jgi:transposase
VEWTEGSALDQREKRARERACAAGLRVSEEDQIQFTASKGPKRLRSFASLRAGGFQKTLSERVKALQEAHSQAEVELWAEDEARLGLKPVTRRVWAPVGQRPTARVKRGYEWTYLYGFVRPTTGEVYWLILPTVNKELFSMALQEFAKEVGVGEDKHALLVLDQAGWHTSGEVEIPRGIHLEFLPSGSAELQPAERLWPLTNEAIANRLFEEISQIEQALVQRCVELLGRASIISNLTNYHWWPQAA